MLKTRLEVTLCCTSVSVLTAANCIVYCSSQTFIFRVPFVFGLPLFFGGSLALLYESHMSDSYMDNHTLVVHIQTFATQ